MISRGSRLSKLKNGETQINLYLDNIKQILYKRVRCGYCGHVLRYRTSSSRNYYFCRTANYTDKYGCTSTQYSEDEIINIVKTVVKSYMDIILNLERLSTDLKQTQNTSSVQKIIARLTGEIEQLQSSKRLLYERYKKGSLDKETYFKDRESIECNINNKTLERETLSVHNIEQEEVLNMAHCFFGSFTQFQIGDEPNAEVINSLVESILIFDRDKTKVNLSFAEKLEKALHALNQSL